jgi:hypothetical protein
VAKDPKEAFRRLYEASDREQLAQAGRAHLAGNLALKARRHTRWFWTGFAICLLLGVWLTVLGVVYLLERASKSADRFERARREHLDRARPD